MKGVSARAAPCGSRRTEVRYILAVDAPDFAPFLERLPPFPEAKEGRSGHGAMAVRYEDVTQDGRLAVRAGAQAIGVSVWQPVLERHPASRALLAQGIVPILTRLVVVTGGGPFSARVPVHADGAFELVEARDVGRKSRFRVDMWATMRSVRSSTFGPPPGPDAEPVAIGAMWAEHVVTRPFAPPDERSVSELPRELAPERIVAHTDPPSVIAGDATTRWIDDAWRASETPIVFGMSHTDSNQHVNSLAYPILLEEAALHDRARRGEGTSLFASRFEMAYRKPSFAGERLVLRIRRYERTLPSGRTFLGVAGVFATKEEHEGPLEKARVFGTIELEP